MYRAVRPIASRSALFSNTTSNRAISMWQWLKGEAKQPDCEPDFKYKLPSNDEDPSLKQIQKDDELSTRFKDECGQGNALREQIRSLGGRPGGRGKMF